MGVRTREETMLFGKHINRYYLKYLYLLLFGLAALFVVDYVQLQIPRLYNYLINGINKGVVTLDDGTTTVFDFDFVLTYICQPMLWIILAMILCRFLWRPTV